jgi:hypothetical protein
VRVSGREKRRGWRTVDKVGITLFKEERKKETDTERAKTVKTGGGE